MPNAALTSGDIHDLAISVEQLTEETRLLRQALDELRDDVVWAARQVLTRGDDVRSRPPPCDPLAPDTFTSASEQRIDAPVVTHAMDQADETVESPYCCDRPKLAWNGDPDAPGVACENCGYIVAESGSVVMWCEEGGSLSGKKPAEPEQRQGSLF